MMGRKQIIDRETLLDAAEAVVFREGAGQFTIDAVAAEAGVSKGGVLYAFSTKDALIDALFERVFASFDESIESFINEAGDSPENRVKAHVLANQGAKEPVAGRMTALIINFMRSPEYRQEAAEYYNDLLQGLDVSTPRGRRTRLALLACEGAFMLRGFDSASMSEESWQDIHNDIVAILLT